MKDSVARIESLDAVVERMLDDADLDWFYERLEHFKVPHLAGSDIARLARAAQGQPAPRHVVPQLPVAVEPRSMSGCSAPEPTQLWEFVMAMKTTDAPTGSKPVLILDRKGAVILGVVMALPFLYFAGDALGIPAVRGTGAIALIAVTSVIAVIWNARKRANSIRSVREHYDRALVSADAFKDAIAGAKARKA